LSWKHCLVCSESISPTSISRLKGSSFSIEIVQIYVSTKRTEILVHSIPRFFGLISTSIVSLERPIYSFEPRLLIQQEFTVAPTIEPNAFVVVVQFEVRSPAPDYQVSGDSISLHTGIVARQKAIVFGILLAGGVVAIRWIYSCCFPLVFHNFFFVGGRAKFRRFIRTVPAISVTVAESLDRKTISSFATEG